MAAVAKAFAFYVSKLKGGCLRKHKHTQDMQL